MLLNIRPVPAPTLTGLRAEPTVKAVRLSWDVCPDATYKATEVWTSTDVSFSTASRLAVVTGNTYTHTADDVVTRYYRVRSVNIYDRADGAWSDIVSGTGKLIGLADLASEALARTLILQSSSQLFQISKTGTNSPGSITLTAFARNLVGTPNWTIPSGTATLSAGSDNWNKVLNFANMATDTVTIQVSQDGLTDTMTIVKVREGNDAVTGLLTNEAANVAATSAGVVSSFAGTGGTFKVFDGLLDKTGDAAVAYSVAASSGVTISIAASGAYTITAMSADTGSATLRAVYKGVTVDKVYTIAKAKAGTNGTNGTNGYDGQRGTVDIVKVVAGGPWDSTAANTAIGSAGYGNPINRDRVTLTNNSSYSETRFYDNGSWLTIAAWINGNMVVDGTLSASKITTGYMSADRINGGEIRGVTMNIGGNFRVFTDGTSQLYTANLTRCTGSNGDAPGFPAFSASANGSNSFGNGPAIRANGGGYGNALDITGGANGIVQSGGGANWLRNIIPTTGDAYSLGASATVDAPAGYSWLDLYLKNSPIITSDARTKTDIVDSPLGLAFVNSLRPVAYRQVVGQYSTVDTELVGPAENGAPLMHTEQVPQAGRRRHFGLLAQEVRAAALAHGADDAAFWTLADPLDPDSRQSLRYEELIAPLVKAVQELHLEVQRQGAEITALKAQLSGP